MKRLFSHRVLILASLVLFFVSKSNADNIDSLLMIINNQSGEEKYNNLLILSEHYYSKSGKKAIKYGLLAVEEAKKLKDQNLIAKALFSVRDAYNIQTIHDSSIFYLKKILELDNIEMEYTAKATYIMSESLTHLGRNDEAIQACKQALEIQMELKDTIAMAKTYSMLLVIYSKQANYPDALEYGFKALEIFEQENDSLLIAKTLMRIGTIYMIKRDRPSAGPYYFKAFKIAEKYPNSMIYNSMLANMASYYRNTGKIDSAMMFYKMSIDVDKKLGRTQDIAGTHMNIAHIYLRQDNYDSGYFYLNKALTGFKEVGAEGQIGNVYSSLSLANYYQGNYETSLDYCNKAIEIGTKTNNNRVVYLGKEKLPDILEKMGDYKKSLEYYKDFVVYKDSLDGVKVQNKLAELETKYETSKKEQQIKDLTHQKEIEKKEKQLQRIVLGSFIVGLFLILIFILQKRKKDRLIHKQKELVHKKEKELANAELEKSKLKEEELQQSVLYKSKQLSTHALHMVQKNTILQEIQQEVKDLSKKASTDEKPRYRRINLQINQSMRSDNDWDVFKLYFEEINKNFYAHLKNINPELTTNDYRLCALIKLNMNSKEMASVLNIAPSSIKSARYRLKKKLKLDIDADLEEFIRKID